MVKTSVKMLATDKGADGGVEVKTYRRDETYCLGLSLAKAFVEDRKTAEYADEPAGVDEVKEDKVIDWFDVDFKRDKHITTEVLVVKCSELKIDPPNSANKTELLTLIQAKLKEDGATWSGTEEKKSLIDKAKDFVTGGDKD